MPKLTLFIILTLLFSLSSSFATSPDKDDVTLLLPSQTQEHDPEQISTVGFADIFPEINGPKSTDNHDRPMRIVRIHPINRHFPALGSLRMPHHGCRHHRNYEKPISRISFNDDINMFVVSGENGDFDPMVHIELPERMVRIHRHHRQHHLRHDGMMRFPMGKHHDFFANHRFGEERDVERKRERDWERDGAREVRQDGSFMKSVRKFFNGPL